MIQTLLFQNGQVVTMKIKTCLNIL